MTHFLRPLAFAFLATLAAGCGTGVIDEPDPEPSDDPAIDTTGFASLCEAAQPPSFAAAIRADAGADYVGISQVAENDAIYVIDEDGIPCVTGVPDEMCQLAVDNATTSWGFSGGGYAMLFAVVATGPEVTVVETRDALVDLVVPIDDEVQALLMAWTLGYDVDCSSLERGAFKAVDDGYELLLYRSDSCQQWLVHVVVDGTVTEIEPGESFDCEPDT